MSASRTTIRGAPTEVDREIRDRVRVEQMRMLFDTPLPGSVVATAFAFALAWHMRGVIADSTLVVWLVVKCLTVLPRIVHGTLFRRRANDALAWMAWGKVLLLIDGLAWGSAGVVLMDPTDISGMTVVVATLSGVGAIAAFAIHAEWQACTLFTSGLLLPCIGYFFLRGDAFGLYGGLAIAAFMGLLLAAARRSEHHVVELLTLRFTNGRLTRDLSLALDKAKEESRTKDSFVANMSHELRTPLHGILGLSRSLFRNVAPSEREMVSLIQRSGEHLLGLINNILEFSRFEAHGIDVHPQEVDVVRILDEAVAMCMPSAVERQLDLSATLDLQSPLVALIDPFRVRQILLNLVGNAIKFTEAGGSIKVQASENAIGDGIVITVADTGVGMAPVALEHLFEPFSQGDTSTTRRHGGTGLGLSITRAICRQLGGDIHCSSARGEGSTFTVTLPLQRVSADEQQTLQNTRRDSGFLAAHFGGSTVLLAEDNEVNALVAEFALKRLGVHVEHVDSGVAVVERMCTLGERPDLVLLDCQMPVMDGFQASRRVRAYEQEHGLRRAPLVALTANVFQTDRDRCREAGMDAFLGKPFSEEELRDVLEMFAVVPLSEPAALDAIPSTYAARL